MMRAGPRAPAVALVLAWSAAARAQAPDAVTTESPSSELRSFDAAPPSPSHTPAAPAPPEPLPPPTAPAPNEASAPPRPAPRPRLERARPTVLRAELVGSLFWRRFRYDDDLYGSLRDYDLNAAPALGFAVRAYPGAAFTRAWPAHLGVELAYAGAIGLRTTRADGVTFPTRALRLDVGLAGRLPIGAHAIGAVVGYGRQVFSIEAAPAAPGVDNLPGVPSVDYRFVRLRAEARLSLGRGVDLLAYAGYLVVYATGGIHSDRWFPRSRAGGFEVGLGARYALSHGLDVGLSFDYRQFFFSMHPQPGDPYIAGGAVDRFPAMRLHLGWQY